MLKNIAEIVYFMQTRQYQRANDSYLRLSIGNAPWPIGVTMVGYVSLPHIPSSIQIQTVVDTMFCFTVSMNDQPEKRSRRTKLPMYWTMKLVESIFRVWKGTRCLRVDWVYRLTCFAHTGFWRSRKRSIHQMICLNSWDRYGNFLTILGEGSGESFLRSHSGISLFWYMCNTMKHGKQLQRARHMSPKGASPNWLGF